MSFPLWVLVLSFIIGYLTGGAVTEFINRLFRNRGDQDIWMP